MIKQNPKNLGGETCKIFSIKRKKRSKVEPEVY